METLKTIYVVLIGMLFLAGTASADTFAYSVQSDGDDNLYKINLNTGAAQKIGPVGQGFDDVEGLSFHPGTGVLFGLNNFESDELITIDTSTGAGTAVGPLFPGAGDVVIDVGLAFSSKDELWMATDVPGKFYSINPVTGQATEVGSMGQRVNGLAYWGAVMYGLGGDNTNNLVTINLLTGLATSVGPLVNVSLADGGICFAPDGTLWGIGEYGTIFTIDTSTGLSTVVSTTLSGFESLAIVPEPATVILLGLSGLTLLRKKRRIV